MNHQWQRRLWRSTAFVFPLIQMLWGQPGNINDGNRGRSNQSWVNLSALRPSQKIRVPRMKSEQLPSRFVSVSAEAIVISLKKGEGRVSRADVMSITTPSSGKRLRNTLIGLGIGAGIGAIVGRALSSYPVDVPL